MGKEVRDAPFHILTHPERRQLLSLFAETDDDMSLEDCVTFLARTMEIDAATARIHVHHQHLPKLAQERILEYDVRSGAIWVCPVQLERLVELSECIEEP